MSYTIQGQCSLCDGDVVLYDAWMATTPQVATCLRCGARAKPIRNVIEMEQPKRKRVDVIGVPITGAGEWMKS